MKKSNPLRIAGQVLKVIWNLLVIINACINEIYWWRIFKFKVNGFFEGEPPVLLNGVYRHNNVDIIWEMWVRKTILSGIKTKEFTPYIINLAVKEAMEHLDRTTLLDLFNIDTVWVLNIAITRLISIKGMTTYHFFSEMKSLNFKFLEERRDEVLEKILS